jgi:hypothetical protein
VKQSAFGPIQSDGGHHAARNPIRQPAFPQGNKNQVIFFERVLTAEFISTLAPIAKALPEIASPSQSVQNLGGRGWKLAALTISEKIKLTCLSITLRASGFGALHHFQRYLFMIITSCIKYSIVILCSCPYTHRSNHWGGSEARLNHSIYH